MKKTPLDCESLPRKTHLGVWSDDITLEQYSGLSKIAKSALVSRVKSSSLTFHSFLIFLVILAQFLKKQMPFYLFFNGFKFLALFLFDFLLLALKAHSKV